MPDIKPADSFGGGERLLIKVILPDQGDSKRVSGGGGKVQPFRSVDPAFRRSLSTRILALRDAIEPAARRIGAAPAKVRLVPKALAKSHRPERLFSDETCPIIGAGRPGELFIRATPGGVNALNRLIRTGRSKQLVKEISTIDTIEPITSDDRLNRRTPHDVLRHSPKRHDGYVTKVQLFDLRRNQELLERDFFDQCEGAGISVRQGGFTAASQHVEAICREPHDVALLSQIVGVRSVREMPVMTMIRTLATAGRPVPSNLPLPEEPLSQYPVVGVVDSGVRDDVPALSAWLLGRESTVAPEYRNAEHGTFVAGLIVFARSFNTDLGSIDAGPCAIFDVQVMPNADPGVGEVEELTESELLQALEDVLRQHSNEVKVWNLSLGTNEVCSFDFFSSFGVELDRLQETYGVSFVISAGNYDKRPRLNYPRTGSELEAGRITTPADSVLGITVGSVSHLAMPSGGRRGEPSPFSRHGAGPNYIIKPDLIHYGGTCSVDGTKACGVASIVGPNLVAESCGTSFSTPLVSRLLASIYHHVTPAPSRELARAILTHHARDPRDGQRVPDREENFLGFGLPSTAPVSLGCSPWMSTLVFEDTLRPGYFLEWDNFPYPRSLTRNGRFYGDIWMTLAFAPARGASWGSEYCETHVEAHFGVWHAPKRRDGQSAKLEFMGKVPPEHKNPGQLYESFQVEHLRKWAPVRTYAGSLGSSGALGLRWRLKLELLSRHSTGERAMKPQPFALVLTIADPAKTAPVYDEMAQQILQRFTARNLTLRTAARIRVAR